MTLAWHQSVGYMHVRRAIAKARGSQVVRRATK